MGALDGGGDLGHRHDGQAAAAIAIRRHHPGRASAKRSIRKELDPTHAQPVIAKSRAQTEFDCGIKRLAGDHGPDP